MFYSIFMAFTLMFFVSSCEKTPALKVQAEANLPDSVYNIIASDTSASMAQKNAIMEGVREAMLAAPKDQAARDEGIRAAVDKNGAVAGLFAAIKSAVDKAEPIPASGPSLKSEADSGLASLVYKIIANNTSASIAQKNAIMDGVRLAMSATPKIQIARDNAIKAAVDKNGALAGLFAAIKLAVDTADPIPSEPNLKNEADSGLPALVYKIIANNTSGSIAQKNAIIEGVRLAISATPKVQVTRDNAIKAAVDKNGALAGLFAAIKLAVDTADPIPSGPNLKSEADSALPSLVYKVIANNFFASIAQKNAIMDGVRLAMSATPKVQATRDDGIRAAVDKNGALAGLFAAIKLAVDKADPISSGGDAGLKSEADSGLSSSIYKIITSDTSASVAQKNAIMEGVLAAISAVPKVQSLRNTDISNAVKNNGDYPQLKQKITDALNQEDPIAIKQQRDLLAKINEFNKLPQTKDTTTDATGKTETRDVPDPVFLKKWEAEVGSLMNKFILAYTDYKAFFYDYLYLYNLLGQLKQVDLQQKFVNDSIDNMYKKALAAEESADDKIAQQSIDDFIQELKTFDNSLEWRKNAYKKLDAVISNYKDKLVKAKNIGAAIQAKLKNENIVLMDDFIRRLSAAGMANQLVAEIEQNLTDFLATYSAGKGWQGFADPKLKELKKLGKNALAQNFEAKFMAADALGAQPALDKAKQKLENFKKDFDNFYDLKTKTLVNINHTVDFRSLEKALNGQADAINKFKFDNGVAWTNNEKVSLRKRRELLAVCFLIYSAEHIELMINDLTALESKNQVGIVQGLDPAYKHLTIEDSKSVTARMLNDLRSEIEAPKYLNFNDIKNRIQLQQQRIDVSLNKLEPKITNGKIKGTFDSWKDKFKKIAEDYFIL